MGTFSHRAVDGAVLAGFLVWRVVLEPLLPAVFITALLVFVLGRCSLSVEVGKDGLLMSLAAVYLGYQAGQLRMLDSSDN